MIYITGHAPCYFISLFLQNQPSLANKVHMVNKSEELCLTPHFCFYYMLRSFKKIYILSSYSLNIDLSL